MRRFGALNHRALLPCVGARWRGGGGGVDVVRYWGHGRQCYMIRPAELPVGIVNTWSEDHFLVVAPEAIVTPILSAG